MIKKIISKIYSRLLSPNKSAKFQGVVFGKNCNFGKNCKFMSEPYLIRIGDDFSTSSNVNFVTHDGSLRVLRNIYPKHKKADLFGTINIGNNVFIGVGVTVLPNTSIGNNVIIGASSLVKGTLKSNSVYAGVPVKYICSIEEYMQKNESNFDTTKHLNYNEKKVYLVDKYTNEK